MKNVQLNNSILNKLIYEKNNGIKGGLYQKTFILFLNSKHAYDENINLSRCYKYLLETIDQELDINMMKSFHKILMLNTLDDRRHPFNIGHFKFAKNNIFGLETCPPENVFSEIKKLLHWYTTFDNISLNTLIDFHVRFLKIHPFQNGNGRVARFILFRECLKNNVVPVLIDENQKNEYNMSIFKWWKTNNFQLLLDICLKSQQNYKNLLNELKIKY